MPFPHIETNTFTSGNVHYTNLTTQWSHRLTNILAYTDLYAAHMDKEKNLTLIRQTLVVYDEVVGNVQLVMGVSLEYGTMHFMFINVEFLAT